MIHYLYNYFLTRKSAENKSKLYKWLQWQLYKYLKVYLVKHYENEVPNEINLESEGRDSGNLFGTALDGDDDDDELYEEARMAVIQAKKASASYLQRKLKVGYARAARLLDMLEERGVIGPGEGAKPREVFTEAPEETEE